MTFGVSQTPKVFDDLLGFQNPEGLACQSKIVLHPLQIVGDFLFVL